MENFDAYCASKEDKTAILEALKKQNEVRSLEIQYILTTGANWKGPIKKFRLEITPPTPDARVMFCWNGKIEKTKNGTLVSTLKNFTPKNDLKILFILKDHGDNFRDF